MTLLARKQTIEIIPDLVECGVEEEAIFLYLTENFVGSRRSMLPSCAGH
jgi:hypothetical protein